MIEYIKYNFSEILNWLVFLLVLVVVLMYLKNKNNRRVLRFYIDYILYKFGIKSRISRTSMSLIHVKDCGEPLVELVRHPKIFINDDTVEQPVLLRKKVAYKIYKIADNLPENVCIKIYSAFRSRIKLYEAWKTEEERVMRENPEMYRAELLSVVSKNVPNPNASMGGHNAGAAIDVSLCDVDGNDFDFGTEYHALHKNYDLTKEQKSNHKMLKKIMKSQQFINNPDQWWHFSYGDRAWAAYRGRRKSAFYGSAEKEFENMGFVKVVKTEIKTVK